MRHYSVPKIRCVAFLLMAMVLRAEAAGQRQMERLSRGLVAVRQADGQVFLSWRLLGDDPEDLAFNVYRRAADSPPVLVNGSPVGGATNFVDSTADASGARSYELRTVRAGQEGAAAASVAVWEDGYLSIPIESIVDYSPGDASMADLDGDGELDIVLHQTSRPKDNSFPGVTGEPIVDAYKLDGRHLWRINLGKNIREGEHYTQFMVYDLDGDGRAEVACKTADGTVDGRGKVIGDAAKDWRTLSEGSNRHGRVLDGPEYFTIFDGRTGAELVTVDYVPSREPIDGWGGIGGNAGNDSFGNRCDRFLACVAYLDGQRPSVVMCRGVYGRIAMTAWDWRDGRLTERWRFDTGSSYPPFTDASPFAGMGGHSLSVGDVDADGRDEIVYQAMVVDDDGRGLYSTGLRHGDAMHLTDIDPDRPGQEVYTVQENEEHAEEFQSPAAALRDARTGEVLWSHSPTVDAPQGIAADIDPRTRGLECWGPPGGLRDSKGNVVGRAPRESAWCVWWDDDPLRELLTCGRTGFFRRLRQGPTPTIVNKWNWENEQEEAIFRCDAVGVPRGPALLGDVIGDWREELLLVSPDGKSLRLYTTTIPTELRLVTLLHDPQYRLALAWQNVVYNKPPHPSFYLGDGMAPPQKVDIRIIRVETP